MSEMIIRAVRTQSLIGFVTAERVLIPCILEASIPVRAQARRIDDPAPRCDQATDHVHVQFGYSSRMVEAAKLPPMTIFISGMVSWHAANPWAA